MVYSKFYHWNNFPKKTFVTKPFVSKVAVLTFAVSLKTDSTKNNFRENYRNLFDLEYCTCMFLNRKTKASKEKFVFLSFVLCKLQIRKIIEAELYRKEIWSIITLQKV